VFRFVASEKQTKRNDRTLNSGFQCSGWIRPDAIHSGSSRIKLDRLDRSVGSGLILAIPCRVCNVKCSNCRPFVKRLYIIQLTLLIYPTVRTSVSISTLQSLTFCVFSAVPPFRPTTLLPALRTPRKKQFVRSLAIQSALNESFTTFSSSERQSAGPGNSLEASTYAQRVVTVLLCPVSSPNTTMSSSLARLRLWFNSTAFILSSAVIMS